MNQDAILRQAFWLLSVVVGLAISEALKSVFPHMLMLPASKIREHLLDVVRLILFLILIIRFYLGAVAYFDNVHFSDPKNTRYPKKSYYLDFLVGLVHFLLFFCLAETIEPVAQVRTLESLGLTKEEIITDLGHWFNIILGFVLLYDCVWYLLSWKLSTEKALRLWTVLNVAVFILASFSYLGLTYFGVSSITAMIFAYGVIVLVSLIDIAEIAAGKSIISTWIRALNDDTPPSS
jgi:hypothetical protein